MPPRPVPAPSILGLQRVGFLAGMSDAYLETLAGQCTWRRFKAGQQVISKDSNDRDVYIVIAGSVRVTAFSASGRQVTYNDIGAGNWFGDFAAIDGLSRSADVVAHEDTLTASIPPAVFRRVLAEHAPACEAVMLRLVRSVRDLTERLFDLSTLGLQNRVHAEILRLARAAGVERNRAVIAPSPKHVDIANRISANREQVTRELSALRRRGLIESTRDALLVPDVARLQNLVSDVRPRD